MSLNWKEIDAVLAEIPLAGSLIRQIHQPRRDSLLFELHSQGQDLRFFLCFSNPHCRLHLLSVPLPNPRTPPRFVSFLRAHVRNGRILSAAQVGGERIVRLEVVRGGERLLLWARLWATAANLIATDPEHRVLDALYRRPKRGEVTGGFYHPEAEGLKEGRGSTGAGAGPDPEGRFALRELPGPGSFNERLERFFTALEREEETGRLQGQVRRQLEARENRIIARLQGLEKQRRVSADYQRLKASGDLILSYLHTLHKGDRWLEAPDLIDSAQQAAVELDPRLSPAQNAERCYQRFRKAKTAFERATAEILELERDLEEVRAQLRSASGLLPVRQEPTPKRPKRAGKTAAPGLRFLSAGFQILVGRSSAENEELLRRFVRGSDLWLHARDYPGAYVFIKVQPGKSVPLEVLLDAGNLALHYSKAKAAGQADVYYTAVKYLRRPREGKAGLVLPTQEKNLFVRLEAQRIERLKQSAG